MDDHAITHTGARPAKEGEMQLVWGPHHHPKEGGPGYLGSSAVIGTPLGKYSYHYPFESYTTCFVLTVLLSTLLSCLMCLVLPLKVLCLLSL